MANSLARTRGVPQRLRQQRACGRSFGLDDIRIELVESHRRHGGPLPDTSPPTQPGNRRSTDGQDVVVVGVAHERHGATVVGTDVAGLKLGVAAKGRNAAIG